MPAINRIDRATRAAPEAATARDATALVKRALVREPYLLEKMVRLAETDYPKGRDFQRVYLRSFPAKVAAVVAAGKRLQMGFTDAQVIELAKGIDPFRGTQEAVRLWPHKKTGGSRPVAAFGIENKALQFMAKRAAKPFIKIHPHQFDAKGHGGPPAACRRILELLRAGYVNVVVMDVAGNFNALRAEGIIKTIPLPPAVIEGVVLARGLNINPNERRYNHAAKAGSRKRNQAPKAPRKPKGSLHGDSQTLRVVVCGAAGPTDSGRLREIMRTGRRGLSQGSLGSPLFSDAIHEPMVAKISRYGEVVHYADNFFVFTKTKAGALRAAKTLKAEFQRLLAGPLLPSDATIKDARDGFVALGYVFKVKGKRAWLRPPRHKLERVWWRYSEMMEDVATGNVTRQEFMDSLDSWCAAHRLWSHWGLWRKLLRSRFDRHLSPTGGR